MLDPFWLSTEGTYIIWTSRNQDWIGLGADSVKLLNDKRVAVFSPADVGANLQLMYE